MATCRFLVRYQRMIKVHGGQQLHTSLEGFIAVRILVDALKRGGDISREALIRSAGEYEERKLEQISSVFRTG